MYILNIDLWMVINMLRRKMGKCRSCSLIYGDWAEVYLTRSGFTNCGYLTCIGMVLKWWKMFVINLNWNAFRTEAAALLLYTLHKTCTIIIWGKSLQKKHWWQSLKLWDGLKRSGRLDVSDADIAHGLSVFFYLWWKWNIKALKIMFWGRKILLLKICLRNLYKWRA